MNLSLREKLHQLLSLTEEMFQGARNGEWDITYKKEQIRRELMEIFFRENGWNKDDEQIKETINRIMMMDKKTIAIAESGKIEILKKIRNLSVGQQAIDAYANSASRR